MAVALRANALAGNGQTATTSSLSIVIPATAQAGDVAVLAVGSSSDTVNLTTPTGWYAAQHDFVGTTAQGWLFLKALSAGDVGATVTLTFSAAQRCAAVVSVFSGVDGASMAAIPTTSLTESTSSTTVVTPTLTSVDAGAGFVVFYMRRRGGTPASDVTPTGGYSQGTNSRTSTNYGTTPEISVETAYQIATTAGTYGGESATGSTASVGVNYAVEIPSAVAATTVTPTSVGDGSALGAPSITATPPASISTLTENWSGGIDTNKWLVGQSPTVVNGLLVEDSGSPYETVTTKARYSLHDSAVYVMMPTVPANETSREAYIRIRQDANNGVEWLYTGSTGGTAQLVRRRTVAGVNTTVSQGNYSASLYKWLRIREAAGTVYWDSSSDGLTWTERASWVRTIPLNAVTVQLGAGNFNGLAASGFAEFDNLNYPPETSVAPTSIPTGQSVGAPDVLTEITSRPTPIDDGSALGEPSVAFANVPADVTPDGILSDAALGEPSLSMAVNLEPAGIPTSSGLGEPNIGYAIDVTPDSITVSTRIGTPVLRVQRRVNRFTPPYIARATAIEGALRGGLRHGLCVLLIDGQWVEAEFPTWRQEQAAEIFFRGGAINTVPDEYVDALVDAGYEVWTDYE